MEKSSSFHTFMMKEAFDQEDEGTAESSAASVFKIMDHAKQEFPGLITSHQLARSLEVILVERGFEKETTLLATSLCGDEVCREMEDELREKFKENFSFGGIAGFPFGGASAFGALGHHIPVGGHCLVVYGPHVGIDYDGVVGRVNRRGHRGSGSCCNSAQAGLKYCRAVKEGMKIHCPDPSDPVDAQQVFVDSALMKHSDRLLGAVNPEKELPHVVFDCQEELLQRIVKKCLPNDFPKGTKVVLCGGVQVNTPEGTPDYFLPKTCFLYENGEPIEDLLQTLIEEGHRDLLQIAKDKHRKQETPAGHASEVPLHGASMQEFLVKTLNDP